MVNDGDTCYILEKKMTQSKLYGPYKVVSQPFLDDSVVWAKDATGQEKYRYKIRISRGDELHYLDIFQLTDLIDTDNLMLQTAELKQYNVVITLPARDIGKIERAILHLNHPIRKSFQPSTVKATPIDARVALRECNGRLTESFIEYLVMRNPPMFLNQLMMVNQFRLYILQDIVDIIGISPSRLVVVEMKSRRELLLSKKVGDKLDRYATAALKLRGFLSRLFKTDIDPNPTVDKYLLSAEIEEGSAVTLVDEMGRRLHRL